MKVNNSNNIGDNKFLLSFVVLVASILGVCGLAFIMIYKGDLDDAKYVFV